MLHRIVRVKEKDGRPLYVIRGNNCTYDDLVRPDQILGVMEGFFADERNVYVPADDKNYMGYVQRILKRGVWGLRLRRLPGRILRLPGRILRKLYRVFIKSDTEK